MKIFDAHCDTVTTAMKNGIQLDKNNIDIDFKKLSAAESIGQFFAIWLDKFENKDIYNEALKAIDFFDNQLEKQTDNLRQISKATSYEDIKLNLSQNKISAFLTIEGGEIIEGKLERLEQLYKKGVRLMTLCWNYENEIGYGAMTESKNGLKSFGFEVLEQMNRLGMIVDVSHLNEKGFWDVCEKSDKPFMASHSNSFEVCSHLRNLKDEQLKAIKEKKSVVGLNLYPVFLNNSGRADMYDILKNAERIIEKAGENSIIWGTDFDGIDFKPKGIKDITDMKKIEKEMIRSFGLEITERIFYKNFIEFIKANM